MPGWVLSSQNRFYTVLESTYGTVPGIDASDRMSAVALRMAQRREVRKRRDKTGGRTFTGLAPGSRRRTEFSLETYLVENATPGSPPAVGSLVEAGLGAAPAAFSGATAGSGSSTTQINFGSSHGLVKGQAFGFDGELRFVASVNSSTQVTVNAPFASTPSSGATLSPAVTYFPDYELPSVSIFDYWDPPSAVQRILTGGTVDRFEIRVNADYHEMQFSGEAQDIVDSETFVSGDGGLTSYPSEPSLVGDYPAPIPGNLGQAWLGAPVSKYFTVTNASVRLQNGIDLRNREFGTSTPQCIAPGVRTVTADFELFETDDAATRSLFTSAQAETPIQVMFQLGESAGQMLGVHLPAVVPELPQFDDSDRILRWRFENSRAQGSVDDEIAVAFG
jgi:hypothetical protein